MIKLGLFIIPEKNLKKKILNLKSEVKKKFGNQTYLNHLPHCTIYVFNTSKKYLNSLKKIKEIFVHYKNSFDLKKTDIFYEDPITKKNTYIINVKKNKFLIDLQKNILNNFTKYSFKKSNNFSNKKMSNNYKKYGYPFINSNWKPHFTVASISLKKNQNDFIKKFKKIKLTKRKIYLNKIYLFEIKKDQHKLICKLKLK